MLRSKIAVFILVLLILFPVLVRDVAASTNDGSGMVNDWFTNSPEQGTKNSPKMSDQNTQPASPQVTWVDYVKMMFALLLVIVLIYFLLRFVNKRNKLFGDNTMMRNLGGISLGPNKSIQMVKMGEHVFVVGVGDSVELIKEIDSEEEIKGLLQEQAKQKSITPNWPWSGKQAISEHEQDISPFSSLLKAQLSSLTEGRKKHMSSLEKRKKDDE